jgi:hypothetical protein
MPGATELDRNNHSQPLRDYDSSAVAAAMRYRRDNATAAK